MIPEEMSFNAHIDWVTFASRKTIRKWVVSGYKYEFDSDGYSYHPFDRIEEGYCEFGSPFEAFKHAKNLVKRYRKIHCDAIVVIREVSFNGC